MGRPKGSKNKPKVKTPLPDFAVHDPQSDQVCYVCKRIFWGAMQPLGLGQYRHDDCYPGSRIWKENYALYSKDRRSEAGDLLFNLSS